MDDTTRNDAVAHLDGLWKVEPRPLGSAVPGVGRAKELANSLTKWYVQGIVEQQNAFNAALVQAIQLRQGFQNPCEGMRKARLKREDAFSHAMIIVSSAMVSSS